MTIWISVIIYFSLAAFSFVRFLYYNMSKDKMVKIKTSHRRRRLPKEVAERIAEKELPINEKRQKQREDKEKFFWRCLW